MRLVIIFSFTISLLMSNNMFYLKKQQETLTQLEKTIKRNTKTLKVIINYCKTRDNIPKKEQLILEKKIAELLKLTKVKSLESEEKILKYKIGLDMYISSIKQSKIDE